MMRWLRRRFAGARAAIRFDPVLQAPLSAVAKIYRDGPASPALAALVYALLSDVARRYPEIHERGRFECVYMQALAEATRFFDADRP